MSELEQDTTWKEQLDKNITWLEFEINNIDKYKVKVINDSAVYARESESHDSLGLYYLVLSKSYPQAENTRKLTLVMQHFPKEISIFHKDNLDKPTATLLLIDTTQSMILLTI